MNATQQIASQTSRLLLVVFGAEHRRLMQAGMQLLDTCARNKAYGLMSEKDIVSVFVETKNLIFFSFIKQSNQMQIKWWKQQIPIHLI